MSRERIVIVGGGLAGLSTAWHLMRFGAQDVVVVERERSAGTQASAQSAGIVRSSIGDVPMIALARRGARFLNAPPLGFSRERLVGGEGLLLLSSASRSFEGGQVLEGAQLSAVLPVLAKRVKTGHFFADEGRIDVAALVSAFANGARAAGARFVFSARVRALREGGRGVELSDGSAIEGDQCVLAAGAWAAPLGRAVGSRVELTPMRRHLLVTRRDAAVDPRWPTLWSDDDELYARPESGGFMLSPCDEEDVDPDRVTASATALELARAKAEALLPGVPIGPAERFWAGVRTHAADRRFVLGRDPNVPGLVWAAGLGGHGVTCSAAVGEIAAGAVLGHATPPGIAEPFSPARWR